MSYYRKKFYEERENYGGICSRFEEDERNNIGKPTAQTKNIKKLIGKFFKNVAYHQSLNLPKDIKLIDEETRSILMKLKNDYVSITEDIITNLDEINEYVDVKKIKISPIFSYSIPKYDNICQIVNFLIEKKCESVLEIGSGLGLWAALLKIVGIAQRYKFKMFATDSLKCYNEYNEYKNYTELLYILIREVGDKDHAIPKLEILDADSAIRKYKDSNCLFLCWPPKQRMIEKGQYDCGKILEQFQGNYVIYIGNIVETGSDLFHEILDNYWKKPIKTNPEIGESPFWESLPNMDFYDHSKKDDIYFYERDKEKESMSKKPDERVRDPILKKIDLTTPLLSDPGL